MPRTPDRNPGVSDEEGVVLSDEGVVATQAGELRYTAGRFSLRDGTGEYDPRSGGGGITESQHQGLDTLVHNLSEDRYEEIIKTGAFVDQIIVWTDSGKTLKIRQTDVTRSGAFVSVIEERHYNSSGVVIDRQIGTISRTGPFVDNITWAKDTYTSEVSTFGDGVDEYVDCGNITLLDNTQKAAWSFWVKRDGGVWVGSDETIFSRNNSGNRQFDIRGDSIRIADASNVKHLRVGLSTNPATTSSARWESANIFTQDKWYHVLIIFDGTQGTATDRIAVYIDGADVTSGGVYSGDAFPTNLTTPAGSSAVQIFANNAGNQFGPGNIDEVSIWGGVAPTAAQAAEIYNSGSPTDVLNLPTLQAADHHWRMGDGDTFPTISDEGNTGGFDGTMTNMASGNFESDVP